MKPQISIDCHEKTKPHAVASMTFRPLKNRFLNCKTTVRLGFAAYFLSKSWKPQNNNRTHLLC